MEFDVDGESKLLTFTKRPLGMTFANEEPLTVKRIVPGTEADTLGVKPGWEIKGVGGIALAGMGVDKMVELIYKKSAGLSVASLMSCKVKASSISIEFNVNGELKTVDFYRQPLGIAL